MTHEQFRSRLEQLIAAARAGNLSDEAMLEELEDATAGLRDGLT